MSVVLGHDNKPVGCECCICGEVYYKGEIASGYANAMMEAWAQHMKTHSRLRKLMELVDLPVPQPKSNEAVVKMLQWIKKKCTAIKF